MTPARFARLVAALIVASSCSDPIIPDKPQFGIQVTPKFLDMKRLATGQINAVIVNVDGDTVGGHTLNFQPQDPTMLSIDLFGLTHSLGPVGNTMVFLVDPPDHLVDTVYVSITTIPLAIAVSPFDTAISLLGTVQYSVTAFDSAGPVPRQPFTLTLQPATGILTDDGNGRVRSLGEIGEAVVTVTSGSVSAHAGVTVADTLTAGRLAAPGHPNFVVIDSRGDGFVTRSGAAFITRYNAATRAPQASMYVPLGVAGIALDTAGNRVYVVSALSVFGLNGATGAFTDTLSAGSQPLAVAVAPDDRTVWVSAVGDVLLVFDRSNDSLVQTLSLSSLSHFAVSPPGDTLLYGSVGGDVVELNCRTRSLGRTFLVGGSLTDLAVSGDGATLFAADAAGHRVAVWDLAAGVVVDSILLPAAPQGLGLARDGGQLWVSLPSLGEVQLFNPATRSALGTITTHGTPRGIGVGPTGSVALVANDSGWVDVVPR